MAAGALSLCLVTSACSPIEVGETTDRPGATTTLPLVPLPTETTVSPEHLQDCLDEGLYSKIGELYYPTNDEECKNYTTDLVRTLSRTRQYASLPSFTDEQALAIAFQDGSGIETTGLLDAVTLQTMDQEVRRIKKPPLEVDCSNPENIPNWDRSQLVEHLAQMGAFSVKYSPATPRLDLLDPTKSTDRAVKRLTEVTYFALCNNIAFNLLAINTGHAENTLSGYRSQHTESNAFDLRLMNGNTPMPAWNAQPNEELQAQHYIKNNPQALQAALLMMDFFARDPSRYWQVIWSDSPLAIDRSQLINGNYDWSTPIEEMHHDHIHVGVNPEYAG